jgi:NAD(P)-dependent dehydrogenase (short-subunit alcohol dehydrogenase family)
VSQQAKRVALVSGAADCIGLAIATDLADSGFDVAVNDIHGSFDETETADAWAAMRASATNLIYIPGDITFAADRHAILEALRAQSGQLDVLVNLIGIAPNVSCELMRSSEESFQHQIVRGLKGPYFFTQLAAQWMADQHSAEPTYRGTVINVSPIVATQSTINRGEQSIIRAGTTMATQLWAHRLAEFGVAVYEVRFGLVRTETSETVAEKYDRLIAGGLLVENRWGQPDDVGRAVAMLARGDITYATGNTLNIDGGLTIRRL